MSTALDLLTAKPAAARACTDVVIAGVGAVGRELLTQLASARSGVSSKLRVIGLIDRTGYLFAPAGLPRRALVSVAAQKRRGNPLRETALGRRSSPQRAAELIASRVSGAPILVDVTAADTHRMLEHVLYRGWSVVLANKVPLAAEQARVDRLHRAARAGGGEILHEATVGAGLPVIDTLRKLLEAGDRVTRIEGCPSGTLGFIFGRLGRGERFSSAVAEAMAAGYTEPDPRIDLSGLDVARKALILARAIGFRGDLDAVATESLVPAELHAAPLDQFLAQLPSLDAAWAARVESARARGAVLRYRARVTRREVRVGLAEVPSTDPLGLLHDTDNQFSFTTKRYDVRPLVITGPGAGPPVTAAGVYNDLLRLAAP